MRSFLIRPVSRLKGKVFLPGDKSIAHRAAILSAIAYGKTVIENFPYNQDCLYTIGALKKLGVKIIASPRIRSKTTTGTITVFGRGLYGLNRPKGPIFVGGSGTTFRLLLGLLAGQDFQVILTANKSLSLRPMRRVTLPLRMMGACISSRLQVQSCKLPEEYPPITIKGGNLKGITYKMPVASAQVKSAILLAGLYTKDRTQIVEPIKTRDHTERMLKLFKAKIEIKNNKIIIEGNKKLISPARIYIPSDISSASFFIVLSLILPNSQILIKNVSLNPSRTGVIKVLKRMQANIKVKISSSKSQGEEPQGDLLVRSSKLKGTVVRKEEIPSLIDELPILMVAASFAEGETTFEGVQELRVKETDRIRAMSENLIKMGANIKVFKSDHSEKIIVRGVKELKGSKQIKSFGDHRTAMSMITAALKAKGLSRIDDITCINKSFPGFLNLLETLKS